MQGEALEVDVQAAELLAAITAIGGSPMQLDRKRSVLSRAKAENYEVAASISRDPPSASVVVHPVAEHPTSATPTLHALDVHNSGHQPGAAAMYRHNHFSSSILPRLSVSTPVSLAFRSGGGSGAFSPVPPSPREGSRDGPHGYACATVPVNGLPLEHSLSPGQLAGPGGKGGNTTFVGQTRPRSAAARALLAGVMLHPVVQLGWQPLCEVHCNGLTGFFLGGHDRDLFIKCTASEFVNLPMVDALQGGCIMTCSHFEKAAGRELSKKWKESIHVAGEGEGSKATLVAWLKRHAEADFGAGVVGKHVWVCWCADAENYWAEIVGFNRDTGKHKVKYADLFTEELHLPVEKLTWGAAKPSIAFNPAEIGFEPLLPLEASGLRLEGIARSRSAPAATLRSFAASYAASLLHQTSTASTCCEVEIRDGLEVPGARTPEQAPRPGAPSSASQPMAPQGPVLPQDNADFQRPLQTIPSCRHPMSTLSGGGLPAPGGGPGGDTSCSVSEGSDDVAAPGGPSSKRRRMGVEALTAWGDSGAAGAWQPPQQQLGLTEPVSQSGGRPLTGTPRGQREGAPGLTVPLMRAMWQTPALGTPPDWLTDRLRVDLALAAPPPPYALAEQSPASMCRWMSRIAFLLEDSLQLRQSTRDEIPESTPQCDPCGSATEAATGAACGAGRPISVSTGGAVCALCPTFHAGSPSARFQTLLVAARRRGCLTPHYEAMLERFEFFKADPDRLRAKMEDFIWAALAEPWEPTPISSCQPAQ